MRIAFCSYELAGVRGGGIGTYVAEAAKALSAAGHEVWLVTAAPSGEAREVLREHPDFHRVVFVEEVGGAEAQPAFAFGAAPMRFATLVERALASSGRAFDYIEFADFGGWGAQVVERQRHAAAFGRAVVTVVLHSPTFECSRYNRTTRLMTVAERDLVAIEDATIRRAPAVWSPSVRLREMVADRLGLSGDFAEVIRYPMTLPPLPCSLPAAGRRLEELRFLFFGRIEPRKGVRQLVDAFATMPELSIECVGGDGETSPLQTSEVEHLRARGAGNVTFSGRLPRAEMLARLEAADVVILPSPWENWPNTCIESMAAGRVVIGGRNGGMGEMIEHGVSGFLCDGGDPDDIARVVREDLAAALPRLDEIGRRAAARIRALSDPARYVAAVEAFVTARCPAPAPAPAAPTPLISVVVVAESCRAVSLGEVIGSVLAQAGGDAEVLVAHGPARADDVQRAAADARVRAVPAAGGVASARAAAVEAARGELIACVAADTRWLPGHLDAVTAAFAASPEAAAVASGFLRPARSGCPAKAVAPLVIGRPVELLRRAREDACVWFRRAVWTTHGVRFDRDLTRYAEWGFWVALARRGLEVECVSAALSERVLAAAPAFDERAWASHLAEVGVMVERELDVAAGEDERLALRDLLQTGGIGAHAAAVRGSVLTSERPARIAQRGRPGVTRYVFADRLGQWLERRPLLHRWGRALLTWCMRRHRERDAGR